jgi:hypothetical protein
MSPHEILALRHPRIVAFHKFYSEYHLFFEVTQDRLRVSIRVYEADDGRFFFEQSHYIRTPLQDSTHMLKTEKHGEAHVALSRGVESVTTYYDDAIGQGHEPEASWFVPNELY